MNKCLSAVGSTACLAAGFFCSTAAPAAVWYETEAAMNDPLVTLSRIGLGYEYARETTARQKITPNATWQFGGKDGRHDWAVGIEVPFLLNNPKFGPSEEGVGDLKVKLSHTWLESNTWLVGTYFETEFDTAATDVQAIANQRTQMALGGGFIRNLGSGWSCGAVVQYGAPIDSGTTTGCKSEWEYRLGIRKSLMDPLSLTLLYKGTLNMAGNIDHNATIEPSLTWLFGNDRSYSLWLACEIPLEGKSEDFTAKGGFSWLY